MKRVRAAAILGYMNKTSFTIFPKITIFTAELKAVFLAIGVIGDDDDDVFLHSDNA